MKRKPANVLRKAIRKQIHYLKWDVLITNKMVDTIKDEPIPHVRPIVRGKAKAKTEFGAKINISLLDDDARVDHFHGDAFNEGQDLQGQVERFRKLTGKYPELVQVDKIYLTRENRRFLKEKGIRFTGEPLGLKPLKEIRSRYRKRKERQEAAERNQVERKFGQGKRGYGLNDIRSRMSTTSKRWIEGNHFCDEPDTAYEEYSHA